MSVLTFLTLSTSHGKSQDGAMATEKSVKFASLVGQHGTIFDVAEINQQRLLEESEQWLENLVQTYLVLTSGKLVLQKSYVH